MRKRFLAFVAVAMLLVSCHDAYVKPVSFKTPWAPDVKEALADFIQENANKGKYVVFDFDNTTAVFDVEEQLLVWQLQSMDFAMTPERFDTVIRTGLDNKDGKYDPWFHDLDFAYGELYKAKKGSLNSTISQDGFKNDSLEMEFKAKMSAMYDFVDDNESTDVSYCWLLYWFDGMSPKEVYNIAKRSHTIFSRKKTSQQTWISPKSFSSQLGQISYDWTSGVSVTESMKELWQLLSENGIDVWVCSASGIEQVKAAVDEFGLHDYCKGVMAMTISTDSTGKYTNSYDYTTGYAQLTTEDGWEVDSLALATKVQTAGPGKVTAIQNVLYPRYHQGPAAGFCDSSGDFNFCTEFNSLQLVVCFNRANRKVTDGGGLIAEVAMLQQKQGLDFGKARKQGETLYLLQGRNENELRSLRTSNKTLRLGSTEEQLFANENNQKELDYFLSKKLSVKDIFAKFSIKTAADAKGNPLGFKYGFLKNYNGYHSIK